MRATYATVFTIFYLRKFGYTLNNEPFAQYSLFFRNALVRANYDNHSAGIASTFEPLTLFFRYILFGERQELRNRYLHIRAADSCIYQQSWRSQGRCRCQAHRIRSLTHS